MLSSLVVTATKTLLPNLSKSLAWVSVSSTERDRNADEIEIKSFLYVFLVGLK